MLGRLLGSLLGDRNASTVAVLRRRLGMELSATLYCYANRHYIVTSIMTAPWEMMVETGEPTMLPIGTTDAELGQVALHHLAAMVKRRPPSQRDHKLTDWRVYQVSGAASVRSFASRSMSVMLETTPEGISLSARGTHVVEGLPWATGEATAEPATLGSAIRRVIAEAEAAVT